MIVRAQISAHRVKTEWRRMCEEDTGLDVIVAVVLLAIGLIVAGVLARYASQIIGAAGEQVDKITSGKTW